MKKILLFSVVAIAAGMAFTSCTSKEDPLEKVPAHKGLQFCIPASFAGNADTRVLIEDGNSLISEWTEGDLVYVYCNNNRYFDSQTLSADASGANANLVGELTEDKYSVGNELTLVYTYKTYASLGVIEGFSYTPGTGQKGTFEDVQNYDYSTAIVEVTAVDGGKVTTTNASFKPYQSIFKFTFKDSGENLINVKKLTISSDNGKIIDSGRPSPGQNDHSGPITVNLESASSEVWVAICLNESITEDVITFAVEDAAGKTYECKKNASSEKPLNGKYYQSTIELTETTVD